MQSNSIFYFLIAFLGVSESLIAQTSTFEGRVEYEVRNLQATTEYAKYVDSAYIKHIKVDFPQIHYYKGKKMRVDVALVKSSKASVSMTVIFDGEGNSYNLLEKITTASGGDPTKLDQKNIVRCYYIKKEEPGMVTPSVELEGITDKVILGHICSRAFVTNDIGTEMIVFYSEYVKRRGSGAMGQLPGFPLKIITPSMSGMYAELTVLKIEEKKLNADVFQPTGYKLVSEVEYIRILNSKH